MKCLRCKHDMRRTRIEKGYEYVCPHCGLVIRGRQQESTQDSGSVADNSTTTGGDEE